MSRPPGPRYIWGAFRQVVALKAFLLESEELGDAVRTLCHQDVLEGGNSLLGACDFLRLLPPQGGSLRVGDSLPGGGHSVRCGWGRLRLHLREVSVVYLVPPCALFSGLTHQMGWALLSSKVSPSAVSGEPGWLSWGWRDHCTRICTPPYGPLPLRQTGLSLRTRFSRPCGCCRRVVGPSCPVKCLGRYRAVVLLVVGGRMMRMPDLSGRGGGRAAC